MSDWQTIRLTECGEFRNGANFAKDAYGRGLPLVTVKHLYGGRYAQVSALDEVVSSAIPNPDIVTLKKGDILFARSSVKASGAGQVAMVNECPIGAIFSGFVIRFRVTKPECVDPLFLNYVLRSSKYRELLTRIASGSVISNLSQQTLGSLEVTIPSLLQQCAIANVLGALDDKIELNRRLNETLEAIARALFRSWFVDFDPVRAKMEGRAPSGMDTEMAALFPCALEESALGEVPQGWRVVPLDETARFLNGLALQKFPSYGEEFLPVIKIAELRRGVTAASDRADPGIPADYIVSDGDFLFSWSGSLEAVLWTGGKGALNQHLFKVTSDIFPQWFVFHWVQTHLPVFRQIAASKATTMGHIQRHHLHEAEVIVPSPHLLTALTRIMAPLLDKMVCNAVESRTLATVRDTLLPKLMSGEVRVREAEEIVAGV